MKNLFTLLLCTMLCWSMSLRADSFGCGDNSYDPKIGTFDPNDHLLYEFVDGGKYALVFHKDKNGSFVLAAKNGVVEEGAKLVVRQYVENDNSMLFTMEDAGNGCFFMRSVANPDLVVTGGGNLTEATLQEFENVVDIRAQMWALSYCDMSDFQDGDAYTMFNVYYGTGMDTDNQLVEENWRVIFWKNFGAWHPVDMDEPDYEFKKPKVWERPSNATFIKENLDTSKKYALVWRWSKDKEPLYAYDNGTITGKAMKVTTGGATIESYQKNDDFLFYAEKAGDKYFKFKQAGTGKVMHSAGVNMSAVLLSDEASLANPDEALWEVKDILSESVYGLAFTFANKAGGNGIDVSNQVTDNGTSVLIWSIGREWYIFDSETSQNPFKKVDPSSIEQRPNSSAYMLYENGYLYIKGEGIDEVIITDLTGVKVKHLNNLPVGESVRLDDLREGVYIIKGFSSARKESVTQKLLIY